MTKKEYLEQWFEFTMNNIEISWVDEFEKQHDLKLIYNKKIGKFYIRKKANKKEGENEWKKQKKEK